MGRTDSVSTVLVLLALFGCTGAERPADRNASQIDEFAESASADLNLRVLADVGEVARAVAVPEVGRILLLSGETLLVFTDMGSVVGEVELPAEPCGLSVRGHRAVVSHAGFLSILNVASSVEIEQILKHSIPCSEVVLSETDAYLLTKPDYLKGFRQVHRVPLSGQPAEETKVDSFDAECRASLHASGNRIYVACNRQIGRVELDKDGRVAGYGKSFRTEVEGEPGCSRMWLSSDGDWAYSACGGRYRTNDVTPGPHSADRSQVHDLSPSGKLPLEGVASLCESGGVLVVAASQYSPFRHPILSRDQKPRLLNETAGWTLEYYSHPRLESLGSLHLPSFPEGGQARARAVFCDLSYNEVQVLVSEDGLGRWGLLSIPIPGAFS